MLLASSRPELDADEEAVARSLIVKALFERARHTALIAPSGTLFFAWLEYGTIELSRILLWLALVTVPDLLTFVSTSYHLRHPPKPDRLQLAHLCQNGLHLLAGFSWGIAAFMFQTEGPNATTNDLIIMLVLGCVASTCIINMSPSYRSFIAFSLATLCPVMLHNYLVGDTLHVKFIFGLLVLLLATWQFGWLAYRQFGNSVRQLVLNQTFRAKLERAMKIADDSQAVLEERNMQLAKALVRVEHLATRDELTGLLNRRYMTGQIQHEFELFVRHGNPCSLIMLDVDFFKKVNDEFGHSAGDRVLREVSKRLLVETRNNDFASRFGGEEFLLLLPMTRLDDAKMLAERIRLALERSPCIDSPALNVTASFGVAELMPGEAVDDWLNRADKALYKAKQGGRNRVIVA